MLPKYNDKTIFITGQARPSKEDAINTVYQVFSLSLFIDTETDCIVNLSCTTAMESTEDFIRQLINGKNILIEMDEILATLHKRFFALVQKTLIAALKDAQNRYLMLYPEKRNHI